MKQQRKSFSDIIKEKKLMFDLINVVLGIIVLGLIVLLFLFPRNIELVIAAMGIGGAINFLNGYRQISEARNKGVAKSMITTGAVLMVAAVVMFIRL